MSKPYVYLSTSKPGARDVSRRLPAEIGGFARVAFHGLGDGSRSLELYADPRGIWSLSDRPGPVHGGDTNEIARGCLPGGFVKAGEMCVQVDPLDRAADLEDVRRRLAALDRIDAMAKTMDVGALGHGVRAIINELEA